MTQLNMPNARRCLREFRFQDLFIEELGWTHPGKVKPFTHQLDATTYTFTLIAELGVSIFEVQGAGGDIPDSKARKTLHQQVSRTYRENLLIFVDDKRTQSVWYWVKREGNRQYPRTHHYDRWQDPDFHLSKLSGLLVAISELDPQGRIEITKVTQRVQAALDIERVTKKFYGEFQQLHDQFMAYLEPSIADEKDRRWYTSVLLNRIMFIYFLQRQGLINNRQTDYLRAKLEDRDWGDDYYGQFLRPLFFEGFALPEDKRSAQAKAVLGVVPYLNGGLFLRHPIEIKYAGKIYLPDRAFAELYALLDGYSWHLDDRPGKNPQEINPDVLGYIFEKYINQKAFGAYYTRPEITEYLCEQTIHRLVVEKMREVDARNMGTLPPLAYEDVHELVRKMDGRRALILLRDILPGLSLLDPACGSGAFLVAALKTLVAIYQSALGRAEYLEPEHADLRGYLAAELQGHPNKNYYIRKTIISHNLFGVDIMDEAVEIARLRLFLALVGSIRNPQDLEPLPNIDFNILPGNSLIGLLRVDEESFNQMAPPTAGGPLEQKGMFPAMKQGSIFSALGQQSYRQMVTEKERLVKLYRFANTLSDDVEKLREEIQTHRQKAQRTLNQILLNQFGELGIKYEQATWDGKANKPGKPQKRPLSLADIEVLQPFHWGYEFDAVMNGRGGFDAIITNPPWESPKPQAKEFFAEYSELVSKNKMTIKEFEKQQKLLLQNKDLQAAWLEFLSRFPHQSKYYGSARQYSHQRAVVDGRTTPGDVNLYKLFTEQCYNLLRDGGVCGTVIPSGIYTDLSATALRQMLFEQTEVMGLFGFENRRTIFEGVDSRFKFVVLTFRKRGETSSFPAVFMRHDVTELSNFPESGLEISVALVRQLSPSSESVTEFKSQTDIDIARKLMQFPLFSGDDRGWQLEIYGEELHMNRGSEFFKSEPTAYPLYEGSMIWHFDHHYADARYWIKEEELRQIFLEKRAKRINGMDKPPADMKNDYETYRLGLRRIASNTNERTLITTVLPKNVLVGHSLGVHFPFKHDSQKYNSLRFTYSELMALVALLNSFVVDYILRGRMTTNLSTFYLYQLPIPRLTTADPAFNPIINRAARLVCTAPEFDELAQEVGLGSHANGVTEPIARAQLRAELDGLIAHVYGLSEEEFVHILSSFPLVAEPIKVAARNAYRDATRGLIK